MALRSLNHWKTMLNRVSGSSTFTTSTAPKMKANSPTANYGHVQDTQPKVERGDFVPVCVAIGMIIMSATFGLATALHHLEYSPGVYVRKSRRETLPELVEPEKVVDEADKLIKKSFFRKVAHVQEFNQALPIPDPIRADVLAREPRAETLKSVGVDPKLV